MGISPAIAIIIIYYVSSFIDLLYHSVGLSTADLQVSYLIKYVDEHLNACNLYLYSAIIGIRYILYSS